MKDVALISFSRLLTAFIPPMIVICIAFFWKVGYKNFLYAVSRMLVQLLLIGYFLVYIFKTEKYYVVLAVLSVMLFSSGMISVRAVNKKLGGKWLCLKSLFSIFAGGSFSLFFIVKFILRLEPWYMPNYVIPLGGMLFSNAMNGISLAGERFYSEVEKGISVKDAKVAAYKTSLIPITNSLFAVGLVSFPGMMTGQILSGVSPLIAVRYQIMIMSVIFGAVGISSAIFLAFLEKSAVENKKR